MTERCKGRIKFFSSSKGYGFIIGDDGIEYFCHHSELKEEDGEFLSGDKCEFEISKSEKGLQALNITKIK